MTLFHLVKLKTPFQVIINQSQYLLTIVVEINRASEKSVT